MGFQGMRGGLMGKHLLLRLKAFWIGLLLLS